MTPYARGPRHGWLRRAVSGSWPLVPVKTDDDAAAGAPIIERNVR